MILHPGVLGITATPEAPTNPDLPLQADESSSAVCTGTSFVSHVGHNLSDRVSGFAGRGRDYHTISCKNHSGVSIFNTQLCGDELFVTAFHVYFWEKCVRSFVRWQFRRM